MIERTTVRLPSELLDRARRQAVAEGRTLTALIEDGLRAVLAPKRPPARRDRVLPPVSAHTGGVMPGIDISNSAALQEMDDLELARRTKRLR